MPKYRLPVTLLLLALSTTETRAQGVPPPETTDKPLTVKKTELKDATRVEYLIEAGIPFPMQSTTVTPDGNVLYVLQRDGLLQKIALPEFKEERRIALKRSVNSLVPSAEGLLVLTGAKDGGLGVDTQLWIIDPASLAVKRTFATPMSTWVAPLPGTNYLLTYTANPKAPQAGERVLITDLKTEKVVREISTQAVAREGQAKAKKSKENQSLGPKWSNFLISPDAKSLFCRDPFSMSRFRIKGTELALEESGPSLSFTGVYSVSPDSKLVGVTSGKQQIPKGFADPGAFGCYVFKTDDIQKPTVSIPNAEFLAFGSDNRIYVRQASGELATYDAAGKKLKQSSLVLSGATWGYSSQVFVNTADTRMVVRSGDLISCIDFTD